MGAGTAVIITLFTLFRTWINGALNTVANDVWNALTVHATMAGVGAVTLWIMVNGYLIITGASREPLTAYLFKSFRVFILMSLATGAVAFNGNLRQEVTRVRDILGTAITGSATPIWDQLDTNLTTMGAAVGAVALLTGIGGNDMPGGDSGETWVAFATTVAVGVPVVTLSVTVLTLEAAVLLGSALAPIFLFLGIFQRFADWPWSWLKFMFATIVSASVMAALSTTALVVYSGFLVSSVAEFALGMGMTTVAGTMLVGGILVSALMISIPSMVMRLFSLASEGAARDALGAGGGRAAGGDPRGRGDGSTGGGYRPQSTARTSP